MDKKTFFNDTERQIMAGYIAEDNLAHTNSISDPVVFHDTLYTRYIKRAIDILLSGAALIITLPFNLLIGMITLFDVGTPVFFRQKRIGKNCKEFEILKFRNMTNETDGQGNLLPPRDRVTKWGKFVRRTSLDELLNFWSVLKGDMSLIGPRPLGYKYLNRYSQRHIMRHAVRPGLECPQIGNIVLSGYPWQDRFENDVWYAEHISFRTDLKMAAALVSLLFDRKSTEIRGNSDGGSFMGYNENGIAIGNSDIPEKYMKRMYQEYGHQISQKTLKCE